jgi:site-specific DNA recombinase
MEMNDDLLCASLIRYSSSRQRKGHSKETQSSSNRYTIEHVIGGKFVGEFVDDAISGFHDNFHKRTGMLGLLKAICENKVNCVVFYDESRFSRRIIDFFREFLAPIREVNPNIKFFRSIDIVETGGKEWDPEDPEVKRNFILAYKESAKKQVYAQKGMELNLNKGKRPGSRLPYGIEQITQNEIIPNEDIAVVLLIFELASWGYSESNIAKILSGLQIEPRFLNSFEDGNVNWNPSSIHYIINNSIYIGKAYWNRRTSIYNSTPKPVDQQFKFAEYHPVIPVELWNLAHEEMERKSGGQRKIRMNTRYLLSDIITCKKCDCLMKTKNSSKGRSPKRKTKRGKPLIYYYCPQCSLKVDSSELDQMVINQIKPIIINQFNSINVTGKTNEWIKVIKKLKTEKETMLKEERVYRYSRKMKRLLTPGEYDLYLTIQDEYMTILENEIIDLNRTLDELKSLKNSDTIVRLQKRLFAFDSRTGKIEIRYLLFKCIDSLKVCLNRDENIDIDLKLRNLPLPLLQQKLQDQIS